MATDDPIAEQLADMKHLNEEYEQEMARLRLELDFQMKETA